MRILFVTRFHLPIVGGAEVTTHCLVAELCQRGHSVSVFAQQDPRRPPLPAVDRSLGYLTLRSTTPERALGFVLERFAPEVVVVGGYHAETVPRVRSMLWGARHLPTVLYLHDYASAPLAADRDLLIDQTASVSAFVASQAEALGVRAACIPPAVDSRRYRVDTSRRVALFINPIAAKGLETVISVARERPDIPFAFTRCWYLAPGALAALRAIARRLGNVEIRPSVHEPARLYGDAKVLLVPSTYPEAWGRVVPEAQMSGIPVVAAAIGGLPEAAGEGGILIDPAASAETWSRTVSDLWDDDSAYRRHVDMAVRSANRADLSARAVGDRFESLLREVVERAA